MIDGGGLHEDENTKKRREILARRPSYRKILNELGGCEISGTIYRVCCVYQKNIEPNVCFMIVQRIKVIRQVESIPTTVARHPFHLQASRGRQSVVLIIRQLPVC